MIYTLTFTSSGNTGNIKYDQSYNEYEINSIIRQTISQANGYPIHINYDPPGTGGRGMYIDMDASTAGGFYGFYVDARTAADYQTATTTMMGGFLRGRENSFFNNINSKSTNAYGLRLYSENYGFPTGTTDDCNFYARGIQLYASMPAVDFDASGTNYGHVIAGDYKAHADTSITAGTYNLEGFAMHAEITANGMEGDGATLNKNLYGDYIDFSSGTAVTNGEINLTGIHLTQSFEGDNNYDIYSETGWDSVYDSNNQFIRMGEDSPIGEDYFFGWDGTNAIHNTTSGSFVVYNNTGYGPVVAGQYITMSSIFDKSKGTALSLVKDSAEYKNPDGTINKSNHPAYTKVNVTDLDNCWEELDRIKFCYTFIEEDEERERLNQTECRASPIKNWKEKGYLNEEIRKSYRTVCGSKEVEGFDSEKRATIAEQALFELKEKNEGLESEVYDMKCNSNLANYILCKI